MPDLFDNFFGRIATSMHGGKSKPRYGGSSQVNTGSYYSYHNSGTNNASWLPVKKPMETEKMDGSNMEAKPRMGSVGSMASMESSESMKD